MFVRERGIKLLYRIISAIVLSLSTQFFYATNKDTAKYSHTVGRAVPREDAGLVSY